MDEIELIDTTSEITETQRISFMQSDLAKKIQESRARQFVMNNVPQAVIAKFDELANEKYKGSYPAMLQELLLVYEGICGSGHEEIFIVLEEFGAKIAYLQQQVSEIKDKEIPGKKSIFGNKRQGEVK